MLANKLNETRIAIAGVDLTVPNANNSAEFHNDLLAHKSGIGRLDIRYRTGVPGGVCCSKPLKYEKRDLRRRMRAGATLPPAPEWQSLVPNWTLPALINRGRMPTVGGAGAS
jgi:hypothetical protein